MYQSIISCSEMLRCITLLHLPRQGWEEAGNFTLKRQQGPAGMIARGWWCGAEDKRVGGGGVVWRMDRGLEGGDVEVSSPLQ